MMINLEKAYEGFMGMLFDILNKDKRLNKIDKGMTDFMKVNMLFAGPKTIKSFSQYRKGVLDETKDVMLNIEELITNMRKDLGVSNESLDKYDILQTFFVGDIKSELDKQSSS